jgi:hypothetical protein
MWIHVVHRVLDKSRNSPPLRLESRSPLRRWLRQPVSESLSQNFPSCFDLSVDAGKAAATSFALRSTSRGPPS